MERALIIPAAGRGSRLASDTPKVLYPIAGRPMIDHLFDLYEDVVDEFVLVVSPEFDAAVRSHCSTRRRVHYAVQARPDGMLPAILAARPAVSSLAPASVWITWCDQIAIRRSTIQHLAAFARLEPMPDLAFPTVRKENPYIHFDRGPGGAITAVRQRREGDAMPEIGEGDSGLFALSAKAYMEDLRAFACEENSGASTGERNFLPFIPWFAQRGSVMTYEVEHEAESVGVNTQSDARYIENHIAPRC